MYDELVKSLLNESAYVLPSQTRKALREAADAIEELQQEYESIAKSLDESAEIVRRRGEKLAKLKTTTPKWIPVTERLPEKRKWVLCWCVSNSQEVLRWENNEWYHDPFHVYFSDFVTHWMPLPEPPEKLVLKSVKASNSDPNSK